MKSKIYSLLFIVGFFTSCNDFLGVEQKGMVIPQTVEDYDEMLNFPVMMDVTNADFMVPELRLTDELFASLDIHQGNGYKWEPYQYLSDENDGNYSDLYKRIYACNEIINNIDEAKSATGNENLRSEVKGQAHADRARCYWALVNLYGAPYSKTTADKLGVSLILENDLSQKSKRATVGEVYEQICHDLRVAEPLVPESVAPEKKIRACRQAVQAFQARVWLYMNQIDSAEVAINKAFESNIPLLDYNAFVDDSELGSSVRPWKGNKTRPTQARLNNEIIWNAGINYYAFIFSSAYITQNLIQLFHPDNDLRFLFDYGDSNPLNPQLKYDGICYFSIGSGDRTYMISGPEIYLLKAEILARKGDYENAMVTLNQLREKRFLSGSDYELSASDAADAIVKVKNERMREFACTFLSWFDLRRYQAYGETVPTFTRTIGGNTFTLEPGSNLYTLSIPRYVISKNPNIVQNPR